LNWAYQIPEFAKSYRVLAYDHRGHGFSEKPTSPDAYSIKILSEDLFELLNHLGIENCFLVGHSMGGMVAMQFMMDHPENVRALVLVDTAAGQINWEQFGNRRVKSPVTSLSSKGWRRSFTTTSHGIRRSRNSRRMTLSSFRPLGENSC
jgi:pimeloyl-ACP methyl ester carboxylesterase